MTGTLSPDAKRKRDQRRRAKAGRKIIMVEVMDWGAWCDLLEKNGWLKGNRDDEAVRAATEASIWDECREYRRERANEEMKLFENRRTGAIEREPTPASKPIIIKAGGGSPPGPSPNPLWNPRGKRYPGRSLTPEEVAAWEQENGGDDGSAVTADDTLHDGDDSGFDDAEDFMGEDYAGFEDERVLEDD
jgi:hypothetical protein